MPHNAALRCPQCGEPLEIRGYANPAVRTGSWQAQSLIERYAEFLPTGGYNPDLSLGEGFTPLLDVPELADELGVSRLLLKNETVNPTWSFKDRGTVVAIADALRLGSRALGVVSTGNMAASVAAYGARAGLPVLVLVGAETPVHKLALVAVYGPTIIRVHGDYGELYHQSLALGRGLVRFLNSDAPARVEGSKTIAFEVCEQMGYEPPDWVIVPTSSGGNFRGILKGFEEMERAGLIDRVPRMVCAQASGRAPIFEAWSRGDDVVSRVSQSRTMLHAISNPYPPSGNAVLRCLRALGGVCTAVNDECALRWQVRLARFGLFAQPEGAVALAAAHALRSGGLIRRNESVLCVVTGSGLKYPQAVELPVNAFDECPSGELGGRVDAWLERCVAGRSAP